MRNSLNRGAFHTAILQSAALMVPETRRSDWLAEWRAELWHVRRDPDGQNVTTFCMRAFRDAFWIWRHDPCPDRSIFMESAARCLLFLVALGALCVVAAFLMPAARAVLHCSLYPADLVMLSPIGVGDPGVHASVSRKQFESLRTRSAGQFAGLAFVPASAGGRWSPPASLDGWLIENEAAFAILPENAQGFVIGRLRYDAVNNGEFHFIRLRERSLVMFWIVVVAFAFACVFLAIMPSDSSGGHLRRIGPQRGLFLAAKTLLVLPIVMFGSLDLASIGSSFSPLYVDAALFGSFFAVRWINVDQRKRCPVCLRLLANPVHIGDSSRILLEWHGTELMCLRGHGLLYVPDWPGIWSRRQRWIHLGSSWGGLFS